MQMLQTSEIELRETKNCEPLSPRDFRKQEKPDAHTMAPQSVTPFLNVSKQLLLYPSTTSTKAKEREVPNVIEKKLRLKSSFEYQSLQEQRKEDEEYCLIELGDEQASSCSKSCSRHNDEIHPLSQVELPLSNLLKVTSCSIDDDGDESQTSNLLLLSRSSPIIPSLPPIIQSFVPGDLPNFWQCPQCKHVPLPERPKHSVVYHSAICEDGNSDVFPLTSLVRPIIQLHYNACDNEKYRKINKRKASEDKVMNGDHFEFKSGIHNITHVDDGKISDAKEASSDEDYVDNLSEKRPGPMKIGERQTRGQPRQDSKKVRRTASTTTVEHYDSNDGISDEVTSIVEPPSHYNKIYTPITNNGLAHTTKDLKLTASIDVIIISQMERCYYVKSQDTKSHLRQRNNPVPENFPGLECKFCLSRAHQQKEGSIAMEGSGYKKKSRRKKWFFLNSNQVAMGLLPIEKHLVNDCKSCPQNVRSAIILAKQEERNERTRLRHKTGEKITRREYASVVYKRLGFGVKEMN